MSTERCVRCGQPAEGYATLNGHRLCHGDTPWLTCYQAACAAFNGRNWDDLQAHWDDVQAETAIYVELDRRCHPGTNAVMLPSHFFSTVESR